MVMLEVDLLVNKRQILVVEVAQVEPELQDLLIMVVMEY